MVRRVIAGIGSLALLLAGTAHADLYRTGQVVMGTILNVTVEAAVRQQHTVWETRPSPSPGIGMMCSRHGAAKVSWHG